MTIAFAILALVFLGLFIASFLKRKKLEKSISDQNAEIARGNEERNAMQQSSEQARLQYESEIRQAQADAQAAVVAAQKLADQQFLDLKQESERIRQHYETEARKSQEAAETLLAKTLKELEPLRKYESLRTTEAEIKKVLADAITQASALRQEAQTLLDQSRSAASEERSAASKKANEIREQADVLLNQATQEAGRIVEEAHKRAEKIAGDAYVALRDKETLEQAVGALWNTVEGYGDRYVIPTRSLLDDLASDFSHTAAGEALKTAREQSRRIVELKQASACNYVEEDRRDRANRFVVDAFNGRVDAILSRLGRTKHEDYGTLEQEIRDAFSLVNLNGLAFRDARILPVYLDARLAELKWAVVVQELRLKQREEQRRFQEQMREEEKARREYERAKQESEKEQELIRKATEQARLEMEKASAEQRIKLSSQIEELNQRLLEAEAKGQRAMSMAQQTRKGNVYIISNIGSFGENVFKIGMTRRLIPEDRIWELGDASVPFDFDIHAMIESDDAPALERMLHDKFDDLRINKVNYRKEFFRLPLEEIRNFVATKDLKAAFTMVADAHEYRETLALEKMTPEEREKYHLRKADEEDAGAE